jgi:hypothetical protein
MNSICNFFSKSFKKFASKKNSKIDEKKKNELPINYCTHYRNLGHPGGWGFGGRGGALRPPFPQSLIYIRRFRISFFSENKKLF